MRVMGVLHAWTLWTFFPSVFQNEVFFLFCEKEEYQNMDERAVDSCAFVEDLQGPSSNLVIRVAKAEVNSDGSLKSQHTLDPDGVAVCTQCGFRMFLHRRKPAAPNAYVPPPPEASSVFISIQIL